jgi:hypothetical protein
LPTSEKAIDAQDGISVQRTSTQFAGLSLILLIAVSACVAAPTAEISGVVRDTQGVAQMGAMVQVLAVNSVAMGTAFTDLYGRYRIANLVPGKYRIQATAALFVPVSKGNLLLATGTRATVNLTLSTLADATMWIPAERRKSDEPGDDWTWTLRSAANRPMLRLLDDGQMVLVSSSLEQASKKASTVMRASMLSGDGGFGGGGSHNLIVVDRVMDDGSDVILRSDVGAARTPNERGPSTEIDAGYEQRVALAGTSRLVMSYQSHPELIGQLAEAGVSPGLQIMRMASVQKMHLGDSVDIEAGSTVYAVHANAYAVAARPFLRVTVHPGEAWTFGYRMATSRDTQSFGDLDSVAAEIPTAVMSAGRMRMESGNHQEISVSRKIGGGLLQAAVYRDDLHRSVVAGTGVMAQADLQELSKTNGALVDTNTDSFRILANGYTARGVEVTLTEPLTPALWAVMEYQSGAALSTQDAIAAPLEDELAWLRATSAQCATVAVKGKLSGTGTKVRAAYRWQPRRLVTSVSPFGSFSDQAYLGFYVRQPVRWGDRLPPGLEATVDVTNLLAQGYQPFLSSDGRTLFLAQSPRTIEGGLSFTF